jgi:hypothetical protein
MVENQFKKCIVLPMVASPKRVLRDKIQRHMEQTGIKASFIADKSNVSRRSFYEFMRAGMLGDAQCERVAQYLFNKPWMDVVTDKTTTETTQERSMAEEVRELWKAIGRLEGMIGQLLEERARPPLGQGRTGR